MPMKIQTSKMWNQLSKEIDDSQDAFETILLLQSHISTFVSTVCVIAKNMFSSDVSFVNDSFILNESL